MRSLHQVDFAAKTASSEDLIVQEKTCHSYIDFLMIFTGTWIRLYDNRVILLKAAVCKAKAAA